VPLARWTDDGLDRLAREIDYVRPVVTDVAVMKAQMDGLTRELRANTEATRQVADQMEKAQMEPVVRMKNFRHQVTIAVCSALLGGGLLALLNTLASSH
jgi:hypothetical protein